MVVVYRINDIGIGYGIGYRLHAYPTREERWSGPLG